MKSGFEWELDVILRFSAMVLHVQISTLLCSMVEPDGEGAHAVGCAVTAVYHRYDIHNDWWYPTDNDIASVCN
jgi:hypothetical protein